MRVKLGGITLRVGFTAAAVFACLVNAGSSRAYLCGLLSVLIHELTHLFILVLFGCPSCGITVLPGGVRIDTPAFDCLTNCQAAACLLSAPAVNLLIGIVLYPLIPPSSSGTSPALLNITLGTVNLIPMSFLDGGRALDRLFLSRLSDTARRKSIRSIDCLCLFVLVLFTVVLAVGRVYPIPFYLFVIYCFAASFSSRKNHVAFCGSS